MVAILSEKLVVRPIYDDRNRKIGWSLYRKGIEVDSDSFLYDLLRRNSISKKDVEIIE